MPSSFYLARLLGPVLTVVGIGMLLHPSTYLAVAADVVRSPALLYFASVLGLLAGVALVLAHNVWAADWRVIITLLGWISILDSASWILLRDQVLRFWSPLLSSMALPIWGGALVLLLGAVLSYFGYWAGAARETPAAGPDWLSAVSSGSSAISDDNDPVRSDQT